MKCPVCNSSLVKMNRQGVEIDFCPQYCGVWLDRGELDKIIERAVLEQRTNGKRRDDDDHDDEHRHKARRKSFLGDLFDLD